MEQSGMETSNSILNSSDLFYVFIWFLLSMPIVFIVHLKECKHVTNSKVKWVMMKIQNLFGYKAQVTNIFTILYTAQVTLSLCAWISLKSRLEEPNVWDNASYVYSVFIIVVYCIFIFIIIPVILRN